MNLIPAIGDKVASLTGSNRSILTDGSEEVEFSVVNSRAVQGDVTITDFVVEDGGTVSDHARIIPTSISLGVTLTRDDPMEPESLFADSVDEKIRKLERWRDDAEELSFIAPDRSFEGYRITSLAEENSEPIAGYRYSLSLKQVRVSKSGEAEINLPQSAKKTNKAGRSTTQVEEAPGTPEPRRSLARSLF